MITRNRIMLELMARGMRISEVLNLTPRDIDGCKLILQNPKSGRSGEIVYIPSKPQRRLGDYVRDNKIKPDECVFPISYSTSWSMVKKSVNNNKKYSVQMLLRQFLASQLPAVANYLANGNLPVRYYASFS